ncbi:MAG: hypothetical protein ABR971_07645 [Acidobacteriaceae bacterium]
MWPALVKLLELTPHVTRLVPMADRYLQTKAENGKAQRRALEQMGDRLRGDFGQISEGMRGDLTQLAMVQAGICQQLNQQSETLTSLATDMRATRLASDEMDARMTQIETRMARLWMIFVAGMVVLAILAAVMIAMLLHIGQSVHGS